MLPLGPDDDPPRPPPSRIRRVWQEDDEDLWAQEEYERQMEEEAEAERREKAIQKMEEWFHSQFEDPQVETPFDGESGEYQFLWGGPFDAGERLRDEFIYTYNEKWIADAVERVESDGTTEWAPTSGGDFYEHPEPEEAEVARGLVSRKILVRLNELEQRLTELSSSPPSLGHNSPPDEVGIPPYDDEAMRELQEIAKATREQVTDGNPNRQILEEAETAFWRIGRGMLKWVGKKLDLFVDESIKATVRAVAWGSVAAIVLELSADISTYLKLLFNM